PGVNLLTGLPTGDYTMSGMSFRNRDGTPIALPFVDIPANQTFVIVTLTAIDDSIFEGPENATFSIVSNANYEIGTPSNARIDITDNDQPPSINLSPGADAYVRDGTSAGTNFGTTSDLQVKNGGSGFNRITFLKFDISSVSSVNTATL